MIRVLQVLASTRLGGAESRVMDLYRNVDRTRVQFDFAIHCETRGQFHDEIEAMGGRIYSLPRFRLYNWRSYRRAWEKFFAEHPDYRAVHGHMTSTSSIYLQAAKRAGAGITIAHARSAGVDRGLKGTLTNWMRCKLWKQADYCFACSELAGIAVFGKKAWDQGKVHVVPNAIEVEKYRYNPQKREEMRAQLGISGRLVIGHVGRFGPMKNHSFLLDVFACILKKRPDAVLLLLGEGSGMEEIKQKAVSLGIEEQVLFLGKKANAEDYYQAMDYLVFPSLYEGMPGTVLEAQAAGLDCLIADTITPEAGVTELVEYKSLSEPAQSWADQVLLRIEERQQRGIVRSDRISQLQDAGFDVKQLAQDMMDFYENEVPLWEKRSC